MELDGIVCLFFRLVCLTPPNIAAAMLTSPNIAVRKFCSAAKVVFTEAHVPPCASAHLCLPINWDIAPASFAMASYTKEEEYIELLE